MCYNYNENNNTNEPEVNAGSLAEDTVVYRAEPVSEPTVPQKPSYKYDDPWTEPQYRKAQETPSNYYSPHYSTGYSYTVPPEKRAGYSTYTQEEAQEQPKKKKKGGFMRGLAFVLVCTILCACAGAGSAYLVVDHYMDEMQELASNTPTVVLGNQGNDSSSSSSTSDTNVTSVSANELAGAEIYKISESQVVGVSTTYTTTNIFGQQSESAVSGTGFVISEDGYILTNYHVIEYSVKYGYDLNVTFKNGDTYKAEIIGHYEANDVAVIKIDATGLTPVTFANSDELQVGEKVYCVGNPLGELDFSMTSGYLSALDRLIATDQYTTINMFQMDAAVNNGNSGGPVYNARGEVIGIVTAKYSESGVEGLGFAIPINDAVSIAKDLIEHGYLTGQAYLGVSLRDVESYVTTYYNIPQGALIEKVEKGTAAEKAGLQLQDIITGVDDYEVTSVEQLKRTLRKYSAGDTATLKVFRSGVGNIELTVTFDENLTNVQ